MQAGDCFKTPILREILRIRGPLLEEHYVFLEVIHLFQKNWMCKKQTAVSHSSTESEIISLDTGLRLDGIPALDTQRNHKGWRSAPGKDTHGTLGPLQREAVGARHPRHKCEVKMQ